MKLPVVKDAWGLVLGFFLASLSVLYYAVISKSYLLIVISCFLLFISCFVAFFFRDPPRSIITDDSAILSPADGTIIDITQTDNEKSIKIFLSIFNVHIQRAPVSGVVSDIERKTGKFLPAMCPDAYRQNKQNIFTFKNAQEELIKVCQIVGIVARRLVSWVSVGQQVKQGEKIGMIKFGSQVDISIPSHYTIKVNIGQKVVAGITKIAEK